MNFLDLSGYMFSGKSAASDLIREYRGFKLPYYRAEFDLIRIPHGLQDLKYALSDNWSWVRSDKAFREFVHVVSLLGKSPRSVFGKLFNPGFGYEDRYNGFLLKTKKFLDNITDDAWDMHWPFELTECSKLEFARLRIVNRLKNVPPWPEIKYHLTSGVGFLDHAKIYLEDVLVDDLDSTNYHTTVTHNMLEPYNPSLGFCFFDDIKSIVVDRDIRDIYMTAVTYSKGLNDLVPVYSRIIGAFDIDIFIKRQKILRMKTNYLTNSNILRIKYEDMVERYNDTCTEIQAFLGIHERDHIEKMKYFNPEVSRNNIALWKGANKDQLKAISRLENELPELCYN